MQSSLVISSNRKTIESINSFLLLSLYYDTNVSCSCALFLSLTYSRTRSHDSRFREKKLEKIANALCHWQTLKSDQKIFDFSECRLARVQFNETSKKMNRNDFTDAPKGNSDKPLRSSIRVKLSQRPKNLDSRYCAHVLSWPRSNSWRCIYLLTHTVLLVTSHIGKYICSRHEHVGCYACNRW